MDSFGEYIYESDITECGILHEIYYHNLKETVFMINYLFLATFAVKNISIVAEQNRIDIGIEKYSYATNDDVGVFIILLRCENDYCKNYDYSNSIFLSIYNKNNGSHDAEFNEGYYLPLAFETTSNGALLVSFNNTCLPAVKDVDRFYLTSSLIGKYWRKIVTTLL